MKHTNRAGEFRSFRSFDQAPNAYAEHKGICGCGAETSSCITVGPPGHPENGWMCKPCQKLRMEFEVAKENAADPRRI